MSKTKRKRKMKNKSQLSEYSGKALCGSPSIRCSEAKDYLNSMGHLVTKNPLFLILLIPLFIFSMSFVSADVYSDGTTTYQIIDGYSYTTITYLNNGTFNITGDAINVSILVVGGGGAGGGANYNHGGGGGAGGILWNNAVSLASGNYNVIVGAGGIGGTDTTGGNGQNSSFGTIMYAFGGGAGGGQNLAGHSGGSGGGGSGSGNFGATTQNNNGGTGYGKIGGGRYSLNFNTGGGGGAGQEGGNSTGGTGSTAGKGGNGLTFTIYNGTALYYCGGGGGGIYEGTGGAGGLGGGGAGGVQINGVNGISNTGGGGGGAGGDNDKYGGNGGSGIIIIRYSLLCSENLVNTSWSYENTSCLINDSLIQMQYLTQYDSNSCEGSVNTTFYEYTSFDCNYCSYYPINATILDWTDFTGQCINETKSQNSTILTYDYNFDTCYSLTGLESDYFSNITYELQRTITCAGVDTSYFIVDLTSKITIVIFIFLFVFSILFFIFGLPLISGIIFLLVGFMLLFSGFNPVISFIIICAGVVFIFSQR